jgi:PAS domain S-box-containing protein
VDAQTASATDRLPFILDAIVDYAIYVVDLDGRVVTWNAGAERLKGYSRDEIVGEPFARFFTQQDVDEGLPARALATAAATGKFEAEGWRVRKDGSRFWALAVLDALKEADGQVVGFVKITRDLTERKLAHQQLLESEQRYRRLIEAVVDYAIFQLDTDGIVTSWNTGAQRIKGYAPDEIIGRHFSVFYTDDDRRAGLPARALQTAEREGRYGAEAWRLRKDGSAFLASVIIDPIRDDDGKLLGFAKVTRDVTERHASDERLKEAQEQLAAAQKMEAVGQLSGGIAHDFNNLLMIVMGNLESAQRAVRDAGVDIPKLDRAVANATRGAQRAAALTSRLLAFSRRQPLNPKPLDLNKFVVGSADFIRRSLGETIEIETVGAAGLWEVEVDANHLEVALVNLAINARDAMPDGGKLTIEATNTYLDEEYCRRNSGAIPGQHVLLSVSDTGCGMAPDVLSRAFEPFFTTKEIGQGTGLGLSQVYGFVKQSLGHLKVYSELGEGTSIKIYLPRRSREEAEDSVSAQEANKGEAGETILVVEDDDDLRAYISQLLVELHFSVLNARDAATALSILDTERRVDLLLTDVVMPGLTGRELADRARQLRKGLKVLFMTGYSRNAVVHHGRLDSGVELLQKPFSQGELTSKVRELLDQPSG